MIKTNVLSDSSCFVSPIKKKVGLLLLLEFLGAGFNINKNVNFDVQELKFNEIYYNVKKKLDSTDHISVNIYSLMISLIQINIIREVLYAEGKKVPLAYK